MAPGDLNLLKSWNPKLVKNRKKVWQTEQDLLTEENKLKERRKEIENEHELNDLINSDKTTTKKAQTGLEWMYDDAVTKDDNEDYLLGKKKLDTNVIKVKPDNEKVISPTEETKPKKTFNYSNDDPMSKFNKAAKLKRSKVIKKGKVTKQNSNTTNKIKKSSTIEY